VTKPLGYRERNTNINLIQTPSSEARPGCRSDPRHTPGLGRCRLGDTLVATAPRPVTRRWLLFDSAAAQLAASLLVFSASLEEIHPERAHQG